MNEEIGIQAEVRLDEILREAKITVYVFCWLMTCFSNVFVRSRERLEAECPRARPREGGRRSENAPSARTLGDGRWRGPRHPGRSLVMTNLPGARGADVDAVICPRVTLKANDTESR